MRALGSGAPPPTARYVPGATRFPLGRSARLPTLLLVVCLVGLATGLASLAQGSTALANPLKPGMLISVWCIASAVAMIWWRRLPRGGWLDWNGTEWHVAPSIGATQWIPSDSLTVAIDLQWALLVRCHGLREPTRWLWLEKGHAPDAWLALRRALYVRRVAVRDRPGAPGA